MGVLTFDWGQITFNNSPLPVPWWAAANIGGTIVFFYWFLVPILYVSPIVLFFFLKPISRSTVMLGTLASYLWSLLTPSTTLETPTMSPALSTKMPPLTSRLTRLTVHCSFPYPSSWPTVSRLPQSLPPSPTSSSTTVNKSGLKRVAHSPNSLIFTLASCRYTRKSPIGGIFSSFVRPFSEGM